MRKRVAFLILVGIVIAGVPLFIDWVIIGNHFPSHISNSEWVGFLGGYVGAIIGAAVSMLGIILTIRSTNEQNRLDRELSVKPYCLIRMIPIIDKEGDRHLENFMFEYDPDVCYKEEKTELCEAVCYVELENVGVGPIIECKITQNENCRYGSNVPVVNNYGVIWREVKCIPVREKAYLKVEVFYATLPEPTNEKWDNLSEEVKSEPLRLFPRCELPFVLSYSDIMGTKYQQEFLLLINFEAYYNCDGHITESPCCALRIEVKSCPIKK